MFAIAFSILGIAVLIAIIFHAYNISKIKLVMQKTNGATKSWHDLHLVKDAINLSMKLAVYYIIFFVLIIIMLIILVANRMLAQAALILFLFGVITFIIGLIGKKHENKIRKMEVKTEDSKLRETFERYIKQWAKPRLQLPD